MQQQNLVSIDAKWVAVKTDQIEFQFHESIHFVHYMQFDYIRKITIIKK